MAWRSCFAGYTALDDFLKQEARGDSDHLYCLQKQLAAVFDRLVVAATTAYREESERSLRPPEQRTAERVKRLLAGELVDTAKLDYDLGGWHLSAIATGSGAAQSLRGLATTLDRRLLLVEVSERTFWAWLGGSHRPDPAALTDLHSTVWPSHTSVVIHRRCERTRAAQSRRQGAQCTVLPADQLRQGTALSQPQLWESPMYEPILFRDRPRHVQIVLSGVIPAVAGAIAGVLVGVSSGAYWAYAALIAIGAIVAGFEHRNWWGGASRGFVAGLTYGIALVHAIVGTYAKASLGSPPVSLAVVTAIAGALLSALGGRVARWQRERRIASG